MAQTSVLPQPTRVERQEFGNLTPNMTHVVDPLESSVMGTSNGLGAPASVPLIYSDDELAVLAESFFHQRSEDEGHANWWNAMSMEAM